eukprot:5177529-Alexandrium_andersonii.AAC.1
MASPDGYRPMSDNAFIKQRGALRSGVPICPVRALSPIAWRQLGCGVRRALRNGKAPGNQTASKSNIP